MSTTNHQIEEVRLPAGCPTILAGSLPAESRVDSFVRHHARWIVGGLTFFAALRILFFAAAFPLSNNIDERFHFMTIQMYAQGHLPGKELPRIDPEFARTFLLYWSPEINHSQQILEQNRVSGPLYALPLNIQDSALSKEFYTKQLNQWLRRPNYEAQSAPLYYLLAAGWYKLGAAFGLRDWRLHYWLRFLNPLAYALLVWLSYEFVRWVYPERAFLQLAVPALIAVFPQDVFYGINRDVFSAPLTAAALLAMIAAVEIKPGRDRYLILCSFLTGLAFVSSVSNAVLCGPLAMTLWIWLRQSKERPRRKAWVLAAGMLAVGLLPSLWMARNYMVMGDLTGGKAKVQELGWTLEPLSGIIRNPIFSPHGFHYFLISLTQRFWRGEYVWHTFEMRSAVADRFYVLSSAIFLLMFTIELWRRGKSMSPLGRLAALWAAFLVVMSILFIIAISVPFDYHDCAYPSRAVPFITSGRIISGAILPFILLYAIGLEKLASLLRRWVPSIALLACIMLFITVSEIRVRSVVFPSSYSFFALSGWRR